MTELKACFEAFLRQVELHGNPKLLFATAVLMDSMKHECGEAEIVESVLGTDCVNSTPGAWMLSTLCNLERFEEAGECIGNTNGRIGMEMIRFGIFSRDLWPHATKVLSQNNRLPEKQVLIKLVRECSWWREVFGEFQGGLCEDWGIGKEDKILEVIEEYSFSGGEEEYYFLHGEEKEEKEEKETPQKELLQKIVEAGMARGWRKMEADAEMLIRYCWSGGRGWSTRKRMVRSVLVKDGLWLEEGSAADRFFGIGDLVWEMRGWLFGEEERKELGNALISACTSGSEEIVRMLLKIRVDVDGIESRWGRTALIIGAEKGHVGICRMLLDAEADVNLGDGSGETPLHVAATRGWDEICKILIEAGARVENQTLEGSTPLFVACQNGHESVCRVLLEAGASPNTAREDGETPKSIALKYDREAIHQLLSNANH